MYLFIYVCVCVYVWGRGGVKKLPPIRNSLLLTGGFKKNFSASFSCTLAPGLAFFPMFMKKQFQKMQFIVGLSLSLFLTIFRFLVLLFFKII